MNVEKNEDEFYEREREYMKKEYAKLKDYFFNKKGLIILIVLIILVVLVRFIQPQNSHNVANDVIKTDDNKDNNKISEESTSTKPKFYIDETVKFVDKDFVLYHIQQITNGLGMYYSSGETNIYSDSELIINQYGNEISAKELADGIVAQSEEYKEKLYQPFIAPDSDNRKSYFVNSVGFDEYEGGKTIASIHLVKVFEDKNLTYSIIYNKKIENKTRQEAEKIANDWFLSNLEKYGEALNNVDLSKNISFYNKNKKIFKALSQSNNFQSLKWDTETTKENNIHADIDIKYPQFKGGNNILGLNKLINDAVSKTLLDDRDFVQDLIKNGLVYTNSEGVTISDDPDRWACRDAKEYDYECSVNLIVDYKIHSIINDVVSLELNFTDYTGGGNGNHHTITTINYDLKTGQDFKINRLFCNYDYSDKLIKIAEADLYAQINYTGHDKPFDETKSIADNFQEITFDDLGITLYFQPYAVTGGSFDVIKVFIPYSELINDICLP